MVEQGATTLWETWTGSQYVPVLSRNHIMFGAVSDWYYKYLAGITMADNSRGWQQLVLRPEVWNAQRGVSVCANLSSTEGSIDTPRGMVSAAWSCLPVKSNGDGNTGVCQQVNYTFTARLSCTHGAVVKSIDFASFGTPTGSCATGFTANLSCSAHDSMAVVQRECLNKSSCSVDATNHNFGGTCFNPGRTLAVKVTCGGGVPTPPPPVGKPVFKYSVVVPTGSTAKVVLPQFGAKAASIAEARGTVWTGGAYVTGVAGVTGASADDRAGNVAISIGSGSYAFTVFV